MQGVSFPCSWKSIKCVSRRYFVQYLKDCGQSLKNKLPWPLSSLSWSEFFSWASFFSLLCAVSLMPQSSFFPTSLLQNVFQIPCEMFVGRQRRQSSWVESSSELLLQTPPCCPGAHWGSGHIEWCVFFSQVLFVLGWVLFWSPACFTDCDLSHDLVVPCVIVNYCTCGTVALIKRPSVLSSSASKKASFISELSKFFLKLRWFFFHRRLYWNFLIKLCFAKTMRPFCPMRLIVCFSDQYTLCSFDQSIYI